MAPADAAPEAAPDAAPEAAPDAAPEAAPEDGVSCRKMETLPTSRILLDFFLFCRKVGEETRRS